MGSGKSLDRAVIIIFLLGMCWFWFFLYYSEADPSTKAGNSRVYRSVDQR